MKKFHTTTYDLYNKNNFKIMIISDIHFSDYITDKKLNIIVDFIKKNNPNYVLIPGDLIDRVDTIKKESEKLRFLNWLTKLSSICKIIISLGNHDFLTKIDGERYYVDNSLFFSEIKNINNVFLLNNSFYEDNNIYVCGITQNCDYFGPEDINILLNDLDNNKEILDYKTDKLKILMIHSPTNLDKKEVKEKIKKFDYIITGHMHNGCVPPVLNEIWKSTRGIITPNKHFLKKYERNTLKKNTNLLVNGPITTFSKFSGIVKNFNFLFPMYMSVMNFNNKNQFKITKKYHKYK